MKSFWHDQSGATTIEMGVIVAVIGLVLAAALPFVGGMVNDTFAAATGSMKSEPGGDGGAVTVDIADASKVH